MIRKISSIRAGKRVNNIRHHKRAIIRLFIIGLVIYMVFAGIGGLDRSIAAIRSADLWYIGGATLAVMMSYFIAALTYVLLSTKKIRYLPTLLVQISGGLVNRLLPAGLGGLGINLLYFKKNGYSLPAAAAVVAVNNSLGFFGNALLVIVVSVFFPVRLPEVTAPSASLPIVVIVVVTFMAAYLLVVRNHAVARIAKTTLREILGFGGALLRQPVRSAAAVISSCAMTGSHTMAMYLVLLALAVDVSWPVALLAISAGALAAAAVPSPGGLGGAEAGIAAVLVSFSVSASSAIAAAIIYRGLTYWLPLLPGYFALRAVEKRYI